MASKWLEERWEVLLPTLAPLGQGQEEHIKRICEAELEAWRQRPSLRKANSLRKPLTQTRNRLRETLPVTEENGWINPKSGAKEHLALKYLNFSTEEWMQMNQPTAEELHMRQAHPLLLTNPSALLSKAEQLVQMESWPEIVAGIGLLTGRGLVEVLQTGRFTEKSAYAVWFAGPMTVEEQMCDPFEVPTLVRADLVLVALHRLRQFFGYHFMGVERREISRQCGEAVREAIYRHLLGLLPMRPGESNLYKQLSRGVYPRLATLYYCPEWVDEVVYMATIQNQRKILEARTAEQRVRLALASGYREYEVLDASGEVDHRRGMRLQEPGVEVLAVFTEKMRAEEREVCAAAGVKPTVAPDLPADPQGPLSASTPLWEQNRFIDDPEALVEKAKELLASQRWEEVVVGLTITTGRCVSEILKTGVVWPKNRYTLWFAVSAPEGADRLEPFEVPTLVASDVVREAWLRVRTLKDCRAEAPQDVCESYRPQVRQAAVEQVSHLLPQDDTTDRYTPVLRCLYARIAARYYCPANKRTDQFLEYVQRGSWSPSQRRSSALGCAACWASTYQYVVNDGTGNIDAHQGIYLKREGVEVLDCCQDEGEGGE